MRHVVIADRFELLRPLGRGGMAEVWLARDHELGRDVAVKLYDAVADRARLVREARVAARLSHPNVVLLLDSGSYQGQPYLVLEYLAGGTLENRLEPGRPLTDDDSVRIAREIARGLAHAHEHGLVHRDLKPSNIVFDREGRAKIADFGIARADGQTTLTETGTILGTVAYMSPEQAAGEPSTQASDVYAFGTILFRMLTGELPFEAETPVELALKRRSEPAPSVESRRADAPTALASLADTALAQEPNARPSAAALVAALGGPAPVETAETVAPDVARPVSGWRRRGAHLVALALLAVAGVAVGVLAFADSADAPRAPALTRDQGTKAEKAPSTPSSDATSPDQPVPTATVPAKSTTQSTTAEPSATTEADVTEGEQTSPADTSSAETGPAETSPAETSPGATSTAVAEPPAPPPPATP